MYDRPVIHNLTLVQLLLAAAAIGCIYLAYREVRRRFVSAWRLFAPASLALFIALAMTLAQLVAGQPRWTFGVALAAGFLFGGVRGFMIDIRHDMYRPQVNVSRAAKLILLWVAIAVGAATAVEIVGAFIKPALETPRYWAALVATLCAGAMLARAAVLTFRLHRHP
jgi:hypothetical protein